MKDLMLELAGIEPDSPLAAIVAKRADIFELTQKTHDAALKPQEPGGLSHGLRAAIGELGASCVVIAGSHSRLRLHAHVADPRTMFETAARFGKVEGSKADDMHAQARTAAGAVGVAVITDSAADLPEDMQQRLNIHMVPARVNFGDQDYLDKVGLSTAEFYRKLRTELVLPRTSQPPPGDFRRQFEFLLSHHRELVYVGLSRSVSGTLQSAETAAQRGHANRTHIFDTGNASCGEGLLAIRAGEMALAGAGAAQILAELARLKPLTPTWAAARDISHAVRGGHLLPPSTSTIARSVERASAQMPSSSWRVAPSSAACRST